jgi:hypothetical protein
MIGRFLNLIRKIKTYAHDIGLGKGGWIKVFFDFVISYFYYTFSAEDYFVVGNGYALSKYEKKRFFTNKRGVWLQNKVNHPDYIHLLENKAEALTLLKDLVSRAWLYAPISSFEEFKEFCKKTPVFIAKPVDGMCGRGIEKYSTSELLESDLLSLYDHLVKDSMLLEECISAHDDINLGTTALSTFRIFTMIDGKGEVHVLKAKYRAGIGDAITDATDGLCIHYPISIKYGIIEGPGISINELNGDHYFCHPGCDKLVVGMRIPMWNHVLDVIIKAAKRIPQVRYVGWDIAITNNSVEIIEGNHNPWQCSFEMMGTERLWWPKLKALI